MELLITAQVSAETEATRCDSQTGNTAHQRRPEVSSSSSLCCDFKRPEDSKTGVNFHLSFHLVCLWMKEAVSTLAETGASAFKHLRFPV